MGLVGVLVKMLGERFWGLMIDSAIEGLNLLAMGGAARRVESVGLGMALGSGLLHSTVPKSIPRIGGPRWTLEKQTCMNVLARTQNGTHQKCMNGLLSK